MSCFDNFSFPGIFGFVSLVCAEITFRRFMEFIFAVLRQHYGGFGVLIFAVLRQHFFGGFLGCAWCLLGQTCLGIVYFIIILFCYCNVIFTL